MHGIKEIRFVSSSANEWRKQERRKIRKRRWKKIGGRIYKIRFKFGAKFLAILIFGSHCIITDVARAQYTIHA